MSNYFLSHVQVLQNSLLCAPKIIFYNIKEIFLTKLYRVGFNVLNGVFGKKL